MGGASLLTQWIAKYGYVPIVLIGMAGLAPEIAREWKSGETIVAKTPVVAEASVVAKSPVVAEAFVERWPPTLETEAEPKARMQLVALDPYVRLRDEFNQPASKGYIMYANSPTNWTPVPLPDEISAARRPAQQQHTGRDRAGSNAV